MLVLTRKVEESVMVGEEHSPQRLLKVTVLAIQSQRVKLGFEVDTDVPIQRWEVWQRTRDDVVANSPTCSLDAIPTGILGRRTEDLGGEL